MKFVILGGAGFIGSQLATRLLEDKHEVVCIDSLVSGTEAHISNLLLNPNFSFQILDVRNSKELAAFISNDSVVVHLASNPDIAAAATNPRIDFVNGTLITESALEATRMSGAKNFIYASGSGVYKENYVAQLREDSPLEPISTYGASKLSGEAMASAYSFMFGISVTVLRFANVVGPRQTHGVGYDFLRRLKSDSKILHVRGDGNQRKPYIHVNDVVEALIFAFRTKLANYDAFNVSVLDSLTVKEIAELAILAADIDLTKIEIRYENNQRGWLGDVPVVSLDSNKLRSLGWVSRMNSRDAMRDSLNAMWNELNTSA